LEIISQFTEPVIPDERRFAGRDPESSVKFNIIKFFLDPGSRQPSAELAGMTDCDTVY
jgi:hypothetical protein